MTLDGSIFTPGSAGPHPAVLLAHGFGGSKTDLADRARDLAGRGYVVLTYSARGFGRPAGGSTSTTPDYEIADARVLVDLLAARPDVRLDGRGDPRVGVAGGSYGGAPGAHARGHRQARGRGRRLDHLERPRRGVLPCSTPPPTTPPRRRPTSNPSPRLARSSSSGRPPSSSRPTRAARSGSGGAATSPVCGRFDPTVCRLFLAAAESGQPSPELLALLHAHSPRPLWRAHRADLPGPGHGRLAVRPGPGRCDRACPDQRGNAVAVRWIDGGHDGTSSTAASDEDSVRTWLGRYLAPNGSAAASLPLPAFVYATPIPAPERRPAARVGLLRRLVDQRPSRSTPARLARPDPARRRAGLDHRHTGWGRHARARTCRRTRSPPCPGQSAAFDSPPLTGRTQVVGAPPVRLTVTSTATSATVFLSLWR